MNTINNLAKLNLLQGADLHYADLHYAELQFQPQLNQFIAEQQLMGNPNYDQLNDESGFEEFNSGSVVDGDNSYNDNPYTLKNNLTNDLLSQQQLQTHANKSKQHGLQTDPNNSLEYAKLVLNQNMQTTNSPSISKQSRVNVIGTGTTDNLTTSADPQSINPNKFESTVWTVDFYRFPFRTFVWLNQCLIQQKCCLAQFRNWEKFLDFSSCKKMCFFYYL